MQRYLSCYRLSIKRTLLTLPCYYHLTILLRFTTRINLNYISFRIIWERRISHCYRKISVTVIINLSKILIIIVKTFFHIKILHFKICIRKSYSLNISLHLDIFNRILTICIIAHIFNYTNTIQRPLLLKKCRIITKRSRKCLCQEINLHIHAYFHVYSSHWACCSALRSCIFQLIVQISPYLGISTNLCCKSNTCKFCWYKTYSHTQSYSCPYSYCSYCIYRELILFFA